VFGPFAEPPGALGSFNASKRKPFRPPSICSDFPLPSWVGTLNAEDCLEIERFCQELLFRHDLSDHYFIGVGRSPSPLIACLQETPGVHAINLPLSHFRYRHANGSDPQDEVFLKRRQELPPALLPALFNHFDHFLLNNPDAVSKRNWTLLDYSISGATLISTFDYLRIYQEKYHSSLGNTQTTIACICADKTSSERLRSRFGARTATLHTLDPYPILRSGLSLQRFDLAAEYGTFILDKSSTLRTRKLKRNPAYDQMRACIRAERRWRSITGDQTLKNFSE
jgi:hypothetical protein